MESVPEVHEEIVQPQISLSEICNNKNLTFKNIKQKLNIDDDTKEIFTNETQPYTVIYIYNNLFKTKQDAEQLLESILNHSNENKLYIVYFYYNMVPGKTAGFLSLYSSSNIDLRLSEMEDFSDIITDNELQGTKNKIIKSAHGSHTLFASKYEPIKIPLENIQANIIDFTTNTRIDQSKITVKINQMTMIINKMRSLAKNARQVIKKKKEKKLYRPSTLKF